MLNKETRNGIDFYRVNNDVNGNPRYVVHYLSLANKYEDAHVLANRLGGAKYRGRDFGGGFVFQSYSLDELAESIVKLRT